MRKQEKHITILQCSYSQLVNLRGVPITHRVLVSARKASCHVLNLAAEE